MDVGVEWLIEAAGCPATALRDIGRITATCERILDELQLHVVGTGQVHQFPSPGGITALYLLTESHLACHTYPEYGVATFNLYCCRMRPAWNWDDRLAELLGSQDVTVRRVIRGTSADQRSVSTDEVTDEVTEPEDMVVSGRSASVPGRAR